MAPLVPSSGVSAAKAAAFAAWSSTAYSTPMPASALRLGSAAAVTAAVAAGPTVVASVTREPAKPSRTVPSPPMAWNGPPPK